MIPRQTHASRLCFFLFGAVWGSLFTLLGAAYMLEYVVGWSRMTCFNSLIEAPHNVTVFPESSRGTLVTQVFREVQLLEDFSTVYQHVQVYQQDYFGKILVIDGALQITTRDEPNYHEVMAHIPIAYVPHARRVLIIGGGDGGLASHVLRYASVEEVHLVDIDFHAIGGVAVRHFPHLAKSFADPRLRVFAMDGAAFVRDPSQYLSVTDSPHEVDLAALLGHDPTDVDDDDDDDDEKPPLPWVPYDVVLVDSTDFGAAEPLFTDAFYASVANITSAYSVIVANVDSPSWATLTVSRAVGQLASREVFGVPHPRLNDLPYGVRDGDVCSAPDASYTGKRVRMPNTTRSGGLEGATGAAGAGAVDATSTYNTKACGPPCGGPGRGSCVRVFRATQPSFLSGDYGYVIASPAFDPRGLALSGRRCTADDSRTSSTAAAAAAAADGVYVRPNCIDFGATARARVGLEYYTEDLHRAAFALPKAQDMAVRRTGG